MAKQARIGSSQTSGAVVAGGPQAGPLFEELRRQVIGGLSGDAFGLPVSVDPVFEGAAKVRLTVSLWVTADETVETIPGRKPVGEKIDAAMQDTKAIAAARAASGGAEGFQGTLEKAIEKDPWVVLGARQGGFVGRSVEPWGARVYDCPDCAGAGALFCPSPKRDCVNPCSACQSAGMVDQVCAVCGGDGIDPASKTAAKSVIGRANALTGALTSAGKGRVCSACSGAGATRETCADCAGAGQQACTACDAKGRIQCQTCDGSGALTDRHGAVAKVDYSLRIDVLDDDAPKDLRRKLTASYAEIARLKLFKPKLVAFESNGSAHRVVFEAKLPAAAARVEIGQRMPRVIDQVYAFGAPLTVVDAPALADRLHHRALDEVNLNGGPRRARLADVLMKSRLGRIALASAARHAPRLDPLDLSPFASRQLGERLLDLARRCHRMVGWRRRRWVWAATALSAPALAAGLIAVGYGDALNSVAQPQPIGGGVEFGLDVSGRSVDIETASTPFSGQGDILSAMTRGVGGMAPFIALWIVAVMAFAYLQATTAKELLGVSRRLRFGEVVTASIAPAIALLFGGGLYAAAFYGPPNLGGGAQFAQTEADTVMASRVDVSGIETSGIPAEPLGGSDGAVDVAGELARFLSASTDTRWLIIDNKATVRATDRPAILQLGCSERGPAIALRTPGLTGVGRIQMMVDGRMNGGPRNAFPMADGEDGVWWPSSRAERRALEAGAEARLFVSEAGGAVTRAYSFALSGFRATSVAAVQGCAY